MKKTIFYILISFILLFLYSCGNKKNPASSSSPKVNIEQLENAESSASHIESIKSLLIQQDTTLLVESYFHGADENFKDDVMSVTKSFTSALIGIAIDKGFIENIDQTLSDYLSDVVELDEQNGAITIQQLLMMSCGLQWNGLSTSSDYIVWKNGGYTLNYILNKSFNHTPEIDFNYSDGASHLLSVILTEATGMSAHDFAKQYLFESLEFGTTTWRTGEGGYSIGSTCLNVTPRDMLKFGCLYLNEGKHNGQQLISSDWINESTTAKISTHNAIPFGSQYGYLWWITSKDSHHVYFANGYGGQFIVVVPDLEVVVVATAEWRYYDQDAGQFWYEIINIIMDEVLPAFE